MQLLTIDESKCKKDGICAAECPMAIIGWEKGEYPKAVDHAETMCIQCGHCVAVCPHGAMTHRDMTPEDCLEYDEEMVLSQAQTEHFLRNRRSFRNFKKAAVEKATLEKIIKIASHAPSGHNAQPVQWQVLSGRATIKPYSQHVIDWMKIMIKEQPKMAAMMHLEMLVMAWEADKDVITRNAPNLILVNGAAKNPVAPDACKIAMTYFDIAAQSFGVGTCWCGYFLRAAMTYPPLKKALGLGEDTNIFGVMMAGHPKFQYKRMPSRKEAKITWMD